MATSGALLQLATAVENLGDALNEALRAAEPDHLESDPTGAYRERLHRALVNLRTTLVEHFDAAIDSVDNVTQVDPNEAVVQ